MTPKRRPHGTGSLTQRKDGLWIARVDAGWTPQGTRRRLTASSKSKAEAARKLKELQRRVAAGSIAPTASTRLTVKDGPRRGYPCTPPTSGRPQPPPTRVPSTSGS